MIKQALQK